MMIPEPPRIRVSAVDETFLANPSLISECECSEDSSKSEECDDHPLECGICDCGEEYSDDVCRAEGIDFYEP